MVDRSTDFNPPLEVCAIHSQHDPYGENCLTEAASSENHRGNLDPHQVMDNYIQLQWQRNPPKFSSDVDIYVWEQHKTLPVGPYAEVQYFPKNDRDETDLVIVFRDEYSLRSFRGYRDSMPCSRRDMSPTDQIWTCSSEIFLSICAVFQVIVIEMTEFLQGASVELEKMVSWLRMRWSSKRVSPHISTESTRSPKSEYLQNSLPCTHGRLPFICSPGHRTWTLSTENCSWMGWHTADAGAPLGCWKIVRGSGGRAPSWSRIHLWRTYDDEERYCRPEAHTLRASSSNPRPPKLHSNVAGSSISATFIRFDLLWHEHEYHDLIWSDGIFELDHCLDTRLSCRYAKLNKSLGIYNRQFRDSHLQLENIHYHRSLPCSHTSPLLDYWKYTTHGIQGHSLLCDLLASFCCHSNLSTHRWQLFCAIFWHCWINYMGHL